LENQMTKAREKIRLGAVLFATGGHVAAWRDPHTAADGGVDFKHFAEAARIAEYGLMDFLFLADSSAVRGSDNLPAMKRQAHVCGFEPITLLSAISAITSHIGLVATTSTSFHQPYRVARQFASLDLLSGGRAGWNLVTSAQETEARNFNLEKHYAHGDRYDRAAEFAEVVLGLWDSWDQDAFLRDKQSGIFFDPHKVHILDHKGQHYSVRGPLNIARSPQDRPVMVQAGSSGPGKDLAAKFAEVVFTAQATLAGAQEFYADVKGRAAGYGRDPADIVVMPGLHPVIAETEDAAHARYKALNDLIHPEVSVALLSVIMGGFDLSKYPIDGPLPEMPETNGPKSRQQLLIDRARRENLTIRQLATIAAQSQGHGVMVGTVKQIADRLEQWFFEGAADGFILTGTTLPRGLDDIVRLLIPELRRRDLFRGAYEGKTLRENLGLPFPISRYDASIQPTSTGLTKVGANQSL
jgi:FMN-dependent oxidoreductase (nitrilotriacetate monooxygenase family)